MCVCVCVSPGAASLYLQCPLRRKAVEFGCFSAACVVFRRHREARSVMMFIKLRRPHNHVSTRVALFVVSVKKTSGLVYISRFFCFHL